MGRGRGVRGDYSVYGVEWTVIQIRLLQSITAEPRTNLVAGKLWNRLQLVIYPWIFRTTTDSDPPAPFAPRSTTCVLDSR